MPYYIDQSTTQKMHSYLIEKEEKQALRTADILQQQQQQQKRQQWNTVARYSCREDEMRCLREKQQFILFLCVSVVARCSIVISIVVAAAAADAATAAAHAYAKEENKN